MAGPGDDERVREDQTFREQAEAVGGFGCWVSDVGREGRLRWLGETFRIFGVRPEDFGGRVEEFFARVHPDDRAGVSAAVERAVAEGGDYDFEHRIVRPDGEVRWVHERAAVARGADGAALRLVGVVQDVTERRRAEDRVLAERDRAREYLDLSPGLFLALDREGRVSAINRRGVEALGLPEDEIVGADFFGRFVPEANRATARAMFADAMGESGPFFEVYEAPLLSARGEERLVLLRASRVRGDDGRPAGLLLFCEDLTERRRAERALKETEERLRQAQKMEAIGLLAGGVAHDFNNLLTAVDGYAELVSQSLPPGSQAAADVQEIRRTAARAIELTRQLLAFGRRQVLRPKPVDLNAAAADMIGLLRRLIGPAIRVEWRPQEGLPPALVDPGQLDQVVMNLAVNARDAMPRGGALTIATSLVRLDGARAAALGAAAGAYAALSVADEGVGMDAETLARAFEPFFTTKPRGAGSGLGLATVYGIARQSGGYALARSEPGRGATFEVGLPVSSEPAAPAPGRGAGAAAGARGTETILLVEDEESVRVLARRILSGAGYRVVEAADGTAGLEAFRELGRADLVLADVVMPFMGGLDLAAEIRRLAPGQRVLLMSGYAGGEGGPSDGTLLNKPFTAEGLLAKAREALDAPPRGG